VTLALAAYGLVLPWALSGLGRAGAAGLPLWVGQGAIVVLTAALAMLVGLEFPLAARVEGANVRSLAARLFTADFFGACVGALVAGAVLIPVVGVAGACGLAAGLNLLAGLVLLKTSCTNSTRSC
jgi:predicted membrane-bound spermidine synthase